MQFKVLNIKYLFKKHEIPLSAIPCLNYRKALEKEEELRNDLLKVKDDNIINTESEDGNEVEAKCPLKTAHIPNAKIETVKENLKEQSLTSVEFYEYCKKVFKFKTIRVMRFKYVILFLCFNNVFNEIIHTILIKF